VDYFPYSFEGPIERHGVGVKKVIWYSVLYLPAELEPELPFALHPRLRVEGEVADVPVAGAWMPAGDGRRYFMVSPSVLRTAGLRLGQVVDMRFRVDDQDRVDVPDALTAALRADPEADAAWRALTPGRQRGLAHLVQSARTEPTQRRRAADIAAALRAGDLTRFGPPSKGRTS
jgi:hypothetical protein